MKRRRQRTYLFEAAYYEYGERFLGFFRWIGKTCKASWSLFWNGRGSRVLGILITVAIVGVAASIAYLVFRELGASISFGTVALTAVAFTFVLLVGLAWHGPIWLLSRVLAGAAATIATAIVLVSLLAAAALIFGSYLLGLVVATGSLFFIWLPLRIAEWIWMGWNKIFYPCPYGDGYRGLPIHVCPKCGEEYDDLYPSFYGVFYHTCHHDDGSSCRLPTMNAWGRSKLTRLCGGNCRRPLMYSALGVKPLKAIVVMGGTQAGKTTYLAAAVRALSKNGSAHNRWKFKLDKKDLASFEQMWQGFDNGQAPGKTQAGVPRASAAEIALDGKEWLLYLWDPAAEESSDFDRLEQHQYLQHLSGLIICVDPPVPGRRDHLTFVQDIDRIVSVVTGTLMGFTGGSRASIKDINVSVLITKADEEDVDSCVGPKAIESFAQKYQMDSLQATNRLCREVLLQWGGGNAVRILEQEFPNLRFFSCSALGRAPSESNNQPFVPIDVLAPFMWAITGKDHQC